MRFQNLGPNPVNLRWIEVTYDNYPSNTVVTKLVAKSLPLPGNSDSALQPFDYEEINGRGVGLFYPVVWKEGDQSGWDNFERYAPDGDSPKDEAVAVPWLMVPKESSAKFRFWPKLGSINVNATGGLAMSMVSLWQSANYEFTMNGPSGANGYVTIEGLEAPAEENKIKLVHAVVLPKIEYTIQPYIVILDVANPKPGQLTTVSPQNLPTQGELEAYINNVYLKQMNVHFTVQPFNYIGPVDYDIGAGEPYEEDYPNLNGNNILDFITNPAQYSDEEATLYSGGHINDSQVLNIYFLPTKVTGREPESKVTHAAGVARWKKKSAIIGRIDSPLTKNDLMEVVVHEIGHLGMGPASAEDFCLKHCREKYELESPDDDGFPLRNISDDCKRAMWYSGRRPLNLFIKEEWIKFRESKQP